MVDQDVREAIEAVAQDVVRQRHQTGGAFDEATGFVDAAPVFDSVTLRASVQPATGNQLLQLPEGQRTKRTVRLLIPEGQTNATLVAVRTASQSGAFLADRFVIDGATYEAVRVDHWPQGRYFDALAQRRDRG